MPVLLEIEVQGARQIRAAMPEAVQVFIAPPSVQALRERLEGRGTDDAEEVRRRLAVAEDELEARGEFQHVVVNDRLDVALDELAAIVTGALDSAAGAAERPSRLVLPSERQGATLISPRIDQLLDEVDSNYAGVIVAAKPRPPDQQLLPQPRRGWGVRRVPAADGRHRLEKLPHDRPPGGRRRAS